MINRATTRHPPHHMNTVCIHIRLIDFLHRILIAADNNRRLIDIKQQQRLIAQAVLHQISLQRNISARIGNFLVIDKSHKKSPQEVEIPMMNRRQFYTIKPRLTCRRFPC